MDNMLLLSCLPLGAAVGFLAGLFGIGGGALLVPILTLLFMGQGMTADDAIHIALGTSMASIVAISWISMRKHHAQQAVRWDIWRMMLPSVMVGVLFGSALVPHISGHALSLFFACFLGYMAWHMLTHAKVIYPSQPLKTWKLMLAGSGIGGISALLSIGGGTMTVPFLTWQGLSMRQAIGTSAAMGVPIACLGTLGYIFLSSSHAVDMWGVWGVWGLVHIPMVALISGFSLWTVSYGVLCSQRWEPTRLKRMFAILLLALGIHMIYITFR
jgi:uncharacterized membrane protein YfcA